jgi:Thiazole biosynthesis protein ThiG
VSRDGSWASHGRLVGVSRGLGPVSRWLGQRGTLALPTAVAGVRWPAGSCALASSVNDLFLGWMAVVEGVDHRGDDLFAATLVNTALVRANKPLMMITAMRHAATAARLACLSGPMLSEPVPVG